MWFILFKPFPRKSVRFCFFILPFTDINMKIRIMISSWIVYLFVVQLQMYDSQIQKRYITWCSSDNWFISQLHPAGFDGIFINRPELSNAWWYLSCWHERHLEVGICYENNLYSRYSSWGLLTSYSTSNKLLLKCSKLNDSTGNAFIIVFQGAMWDNDFYIRCPQIKTQAISIV